MRVVLRWRALLRACLLSCLVATGAGLAGCELKPAGLTLDPPDATDRVRATDLKPQFPKQTETTDAGATRPRRPAVYYGSKPEVTTGAIMRPAPGGEKSYDLNFEDTPIATVAKVILGDILAVGYTIDPRVQGTVTLASGRPVPSQDVLFALESALRTSNVVLVNDVNGYRLVPAAEAVGSGRAERATGPVAPGYGLSVLPLQYVSVQTVSKLLDSFAVKAGMIRADTSRNLLMIQGSGAERRAAVEAVLTFDHDWMRGQSVGIYPVHNTTPEPLITELEKIMDSGEGGLSQNLVKFQAIDRLSAILVVTPKPELLKRAETWINRLDASQTAETGVKVYRVRYGDARQLARLLNDIFVGGSGSSSLLDTPTAPGAGTTTLSSTERLTGVQPAAAASTPAAARPQTAASTDTTANTLLALPHGNGGTPEKAILPGVRITPDTTNNALLIYANQESYRIIQRALNQLDRPRLQVAIDLTIAEVTLNNDLSYGVQFFLASKDIGLKNDTGSIINSAAGSVLAQTLPGFNFLMGSAIQPRAILSALNAHTNTKVLSNPSIVVLDNQAATLQVGDQVPITTGTATLLNANNSIVNTVDYKNTGIILRVVPRINSNGNVLLDIEQEISSVADASSSSSPLTPTLSERKVKSALSVASGQTVLLAGLISETQSLTRSGIPLLEDLPKIGDVFAQNSKSLQRTELIIFIRPQIIRDSVDASVVAEELRSKLKGDKVGAGRAPRG
jgi:general secretion pathway protein D